jgi:hypothetical protein
LVTIAGTMTMAIAWAGGIDTASRPIDTVGRPSQVRPSRSREQEGASDEDKQGIEHGATLTYRHNAHNLEITEIAFGQSEGLFRAVRSSSRGARRARVSKDGAAGEIRASWFETAQSRLLTMRVERCGCASIWSIFSSSSRWPRRAASPTAAQRVHLALASGSERIKGLEDASALRC